MTIPPPKPEKDGTDIETDGQSVLLYHYIMILLKTE